jgi:hypothetical protein
MSSRSARTVADASGPIWASVADAHGRRFLTDEFNHRVVVEDGAGRAWTFGQRGSGAGDLRFPRGLALISHRRLPDARVFIADTGNHRIQVFDGTGALRFAFGGRGKSDGQFRAPADVVIASPALPREGDRAVGAALPLVVVADQWNSRLQVFTPEGVWLATIGGRGQLAGEASPGQDGWPFFRLGPVSVPRDPVRLSWQAPGLTVVGGSGHVQRIDLAAAMLPTAEQWHATASDAERDLARRYFALRRLGGRVPSAEVMLAVMPAQCVA